MINKVVYQRSSERGGASLFIVIFAAMLMTIITLSFIQLMLSDQRQATATDLSQSAYDSAQAGVEDAKRLLLFQKSCQGSATTPCAQATQAINSRECYSVKWGLTGDASSRGETTVERSASAGVGDDTALDQAYTCVKVTPDTDDYKGGLLTDGSSTLVPLKGLTSFNTVELSWADKSNVGGVAAAIPYGNSTGSTILPAAAAWNPATPAMMRAQLVQTSGAFTLADFDTENAGKSNANTLFFFPTTTGSTVSGFALDERRNPSTPAQPQPQRVTCKPDLKLDNYACSVRISLPDPIGGDKDSRANAFLRLSSVYVGTNFQVRLFNGASLVKFDNVQPIIDSTGRANDLYRRVETRVELSADVTYPDAAVDVRGDLCKNFMVTDAPAGYINYCTP